MKKDDVPVVVEHVFKNTASEIWQAITSHQQMIQWFFDNIPEFKPLAGFKTQFDVKSGERIFRHLWHVTEVIPEKIITYNWKYHGYRGDSYVTFELISYKDATRLKLTHRVTADFEDGIPEFKRESCLAGWDFFIKDRLKSFLAK